MKNKLFWSVFASHIREFIEYKRSLGYKYDEQERILWVFDQFLIDQDHLIPALTKEIFDRWKSKFANSSALTVYTNVLIVKQFSEYLRNCGVNTFIPKLPKYPGNTFIPHIYSHEEMSNIFIACDNLIMVNRNIESCLLIMPCLIRILYGTGIRIGEALSLRNIDLNVEAKLLTIRDTKNGRDRQIPISTSLATVCNDYQNQRGKLPLAGLLKENAPFFVSLSGNKCRHAAVYSWFRKVLIAAGIPFNGDRKGPRIHDIRHSFACHSFLQMSDDGTDFYCSWPYLSAYLGHQSLESTEQYIRLTAQMYPKLLNHTDCLYVDILPDITIKNDDKL
jgi:integrase